jgi:hypothetical protein
MSYDLLNTEQTVICKGCSAKSFIKDLRRAANPFIEGETITACPECQAIDNFDIACMYDDCSEPATCGMPAPDTPVGTVNGPYVWLCGKHYRKFQPRPPQTDIFGNEL